MRKLIFLDDSELTNILHLKMAGLNGSHLSRCVAFIEPGKAVKSMLNHSDRHEVNLIFVDLNMPDQHGLDFIRLNWKTMEDQHFLPVPLAARYTLEEMDAIRQIELPIAMTKPLSQSLLARALILTYRLENLPKEDTLWLRSITGKPNDIQHDLLPKLVNELQVDYDKMVYLGVKKKDEVRQWAHKVKGTTKLYGEHTICQLAGAIENQALSAGEEELKVWVRQMGDEIRRLAAIVG